MKKTIMAMAVAVGLTAFAAQNDPSLSVDVEKGATYDVVCKGEKVFSFTSNKTGTVNVQGIAAKSMNAGDYQVKLMATATDAGGDANGDGVSSQDELPKAYTEIVDNGVIRSSDGYAMLCDPATVNPNAKLTDPFELDVTYKFLAYGEDVKKVIDKISPNMPKDEWDCANFRNFQAIAENVIAAYQAGEITDAQMAATERFLMTASPFWDRNCDFVVSFDRPVKKGTCVLAGHYDQAKNFGFNGWVCSAFDRDLAPGESVRLLKDNNYKGVYVTYYEICSRVQDFLCGVKNLSAENVGTTMTVELRIYDESETLERSCLVASYTHALEGAAMVDDTAFMTLEEAVAEWRNGTTLKLLKDGRANLTVPAGENRALDLNGCVLSGSAPVTVSAGAGLTVKDGNPTAEHAFSVGKTGLWTLDENGTEKLAGGCITGGSREIGGGILNGGVLVLEGGNVVGNRARVSGGGIANTETATTFTMTGGSVTGNVAEYAGGVSFLPVDGTFTMQGGEIASNVALGQFLEEYDISEVAPGIVPSVVTNSCGGGGVFNAGTFKMECGVIRDNTAMASTGGGVCNGKTGRFELSGGKKLDDGNLALIDGCQAYNGGGIANYYVLSISGGRISNCVATNLGGGIYTRTFGMDSGMDMIDGTIIDCSAHGEAGDGVASEGGTVEISGKSEILLSFDGFNSGTGVFANGGSLIVRGGKIQISPKTGSGSVDPGELVHKTFAAIRIVGATTTIESGEIKAEYGDAIWAEMYDSKFTLTGEADVHGNITLKVVTAGMIEVSGGKLDGTITAEDEDGNKQTSYITNLDSESQDQDPDAYAEKHPVTEDSVAAVIPAGGKETNGYDTVSAAFNELSEGARLVLLKSDIAKIDASVRFTTTVELNGHDLAGQLRCERQFNIVSGPNGGGETVTLDQYYSNNRTDRSGDVEWGTNGKPLTIDASRVSVTHGRIVLGDCTDVTINSTPGGYAGIEKFVIRQSVSEDGSITNTARLALKGGLYGGLNGGNTALLEDPVTHELTEVPLANYVADGYVLHDNQDWTFSVIPRPVKVETPNIDEAGVVESKVEEGVEEADRPGEDEIKVAAAETVTEVVKNESVANFQDTQVATAIQDGTSGKITDATVELLQKAAETQVSAEKVDEAKAEIASSAEITGLINVKLKTVTMQTMKVESEAKVETKCNSVVYSVEPIVSVKVADADGEREVTAVISNDQLAEMGAVIAFRLAVPSSFAQTATVYHEDELFGVYPVLTEVMSDGTENRFVELQSNSFSDWKLEYDDSVARIGTQGYKTLAEAFSAAKSNDVIEVLWDCEPTDVATNRCPVTLDLCKCKIQGTDTIVCNESDLTVVGEGELRVKDAGVAIKTVAKTGGSASITVTSGVVDGIYTEGDVAVNLAGAKIDRACTCLAGGSIARLITNGKFKYDGSATDASSGSESYVAETHYMSANVKDGYREVVKNAVYATWTDQENNFQKKYYAKFGNAIQACYGCKDLSITLCDDVSESVAVPSDREGTFTVVTDGHSLYAQGITASDGYVLAKTDAGYEYRLGDPVAEVITENGTKTNVYSSVKRAFLAIDNSATVRLLKDTTTKEAIGVPTNTVVKFDLNDKTLRGSISEGLTSQLANFRAVIVNLGTLTVVDSSGTDAGCIYNENSGKESESSTIVNPAIYNFQGKTLTVEGGTIGNNGYNSGSAIYNDTLARTCIKGGKFTNHNSNGGPVFLNNNGATMEISGGTIIGTVTGWVYNFGTLSVGGTFSTTGSKVRKYGIANNAGATTTVTDGQFDLVYANIAVDGVPCEFVVATNGATVVEVFGGTFTGAASYPNDSEWRLYHREYGKPVLMGGTYPTNVNDSTAAFYYCHDNQDGTWTVKPWKDEYDAIAAVFPKDSVSITIDKDGKITVKLLTDVKKSVTFPDTLPSFDLALNRHSIAVGDAEGKQAAIVVTHESADSEAQVTLVGPGYVKGGDTEAIQVEEGAKLSVDSNGAGVVVLNAISKYAFAEVPFAITGIFTDEAEVFITIRPDFTEHPEIADIAEWGYIGADGTYDDPDGKGIKVLASATPDGVQSVKSVRFVSAENGEVTVAVPKTANATAEFFKVRLTTYP